MDRIIFKMELENLDFLAHLEPYLRFYNNFLSYKKSDLLFFEITHNSVIFFYRDRDAFNQLVNPLPDRKFLSLNFAKEYPDPFIMRAILPKEKFPKDGLRLRFVLVNGPLNLLFEKAIAYIQWMDGSMTCEKIETESEKGMLLHIPTYSALMNYTKTLIFKYLVDSIK
jgi:hypothetical protein